MSNLKYTEVPASSIPPVPSETISVPSVNECRESIQRLLQYIDSQYSNEFRHGTNIIHSKVYSSDVKQFLHSINTIIRDFLKSELCKSTKKILLYNSIFDIINSIYQIIDIIDDENTSTEYNRLNSRLAGFLFKNIENLYNEHRSNERGSNEYS